MTTRRPAVEPAGTADNQQTQSPKTPSTDNGVSVSDAPGAGVEMFQDWCLRTYGDSGKTKTVTRRKYNKIIQTLTHREDDHRGWIFREKSNINAKFKFWVKSKGFQVGSLQEGVGGSPDRAVLFVPVKATCIDGVPGSDPSLKRVAIVEDFFDIIYAMHVDITSDPGKTPKHAGQKKTYRAIAETYAFLPREAVTRFLMSCGECQKRMHITTTGLESTCLSGLESKENDRPTSLAPDMIDYNMPLTTAYLKHMELQCGSSMDKDDSLLSSEEEDEMSESTWLVADAGPADRMSHSPHHAHGKDEDDDSSSESGSGNGLPALTPPSSTINDSSVVRAMEAVNGNGGPTPLDFSTPTSSSCSSEDQQPINLSDPPSAAARAPPPPQPTANHLPLTVSAAAAALLGALHPDAPEELRRKYPLANKPGLAPLTHTHTNHHTHGTRTPHAHVADLRLDRDGRDYGGKSPQYSSRISYDSVKTELCAEDLTMGRHGNQVAPDDDDDDHDDHEDSDKINDGEGVDPERLKAFNMFVRLFVDENLDRMVPISKQPKEKIQAIIESCSRQFPEFQERARKRIRTYLKSCRRMKKNGMETRPTPPHLTSAMAENILAAACESESRKAAKRMRLEAYHEEQSILDKPAGGSAGLREPASLTSSASLASSAFSLAASAFASQDAQLYINGAGYGYRGYASLGTTMPHPVSLMTSTATQSNGPTDLSMKPMASSITSSSSASTNNSLAGRANGGGGAGGASTQLSQPEITAVRQLIAGYRESAAFLLRSADELENLILQQN